MSRHRIWSRNVKGSHNGPNYHSYAEMHRYEIHPIPEITVRSYAFMCVRIHRAEQECICHSFVLDGCSNAKFVPMSSEVNVSLHYARKRHERHITLVILHNARSTDGPYQITAV